MSSWNSWLSFFDWYLLNRHHPKLLCATESLKAHLHKLDFFPPTSALSHKTLKRQWWEVMFALALKCCNELYDQYFTAGWTLHRSVLFTAAASPAKQSSSDRRVEQNAECLNQRGSDAMTLSDTLPRFAFTLNSTPAVSRPWYYSKTPQKWLKNIPKRQVLDGLMCIILPCSNIIE